DGPFGSAHPVHWVPASPPAVPQLDAGRSALVPLLKYGSLSNSSISEQAHSWSYLYKTRPSQWLQQHHRRLINLYPLIQFLSVVFRSVHTQGPTTPKVLRVLAGILGSGCKAGVDGITLDPTTNTLIVP